MIKLKAYQTKQTGLPLAAIAHSLVFMGVKERAYNLRASALYDPADLGPGLDRQGKFEIACKKARSSKCF